MQYLCLLSVVSASLAIPFPQLPFFKSRSFVPSHHWSGISPHFAPAEYAAPADGCNVDLAIYLTRHGAIYANDDEWDETMKPFVEYLANLTAPEDDTNPFAFIKDYVPLINSSNLEDATDPGLSDAFRLGRTLRGRYADLFPPVDDKANRSVGDAFKIWSASSSRDLATAQSFMRGAFPDLRGKDQRVRLVKVPNKQPQWATSLTPHKVCPRFSKEPSAEPAKEWLSAYAPRIIGRLEKSFPGKLDPEHVLAMQMLGAYEASITGELDNRWTRLLEQDDWLDFEYYFDVRYHYMVGYGNADLSAALGMPFINNTVLHLIETNITDPDHPHLLGVKQPKKPNRPSPNATHTQLVYPYFTHREEPTTLAVALGLFNESSWTPSLDQRDDDRTWRTSEIIPFLGNIAFERMTCSRPATGNDPTYVRVLVNHVSRPLPGCQDGPQGSCSLKLFRQWVQGRSEVWGDFESACRKQ